MNRKKLILLVVLVLLLIIAGYFFTDGKPKPFPDEEAAIRTLSNLAQKKHIAGIEAVIPIDSKHVYVPFTTGNGEHGKSYWEWKRHKWRLNEMDTGGDPALWRVSEKDPSSYTLVWNMHPDDEVDRIDLYFIRERSFSISESVNVYDPRIQLVKSVPIRNQQPYGVLQLPVEWAQLLQEEFRLQQARTGQSFEELSSAFLFGYIKWIAYDDQGKEMFPRQSLNGGSYSQYGSSVNFIPIMNESELESIP